MATSRIQLTIYVAPGQADVFCRLKTKEDAYERFTAIIDTGAAVSLFPLWLLDIADSETLEQRAISIDQAGIANQSFEGVETVVTLTLEDASGNLTPPFKIPAWFADTDQGLIGFAGVLDRAVLHIDMPQQTGWLEIEV
jgi:hypothetical protein